MTQAISTRHLLRLTDDCGVIQHATFAIPNRQHGYCLDDNGRALQLMAMLSTLRPLGGTEARACEAYAAFVQHAWRAEAGRFDNFMGFDRQWLRTGGDEDAAARGALGLAAAYAYEPVAGMRPWARTLLDQVMAVPMRTSSPRAWATTILALDLCLEVDTEWKEARERLADLAARLRILGESNVTEQWTWWESRLAYENALLSNAAIVAGSHLDDDALVRMGFDTLAWLNRWQHDGGGVFRPVGTDSYGRDHAPPERFDQQPIDAAATIEACIAAAQIDAGAEWMNTAEAAFAWFHGRNDVGVALADAADGLCRDGLHVDRVNANAGAESTLCYLLASCSMACAPGGRAAGGRQ